MTPDSELLATFARTNSEAAFAELVQRHVNLVYSAALRQVNGDEHSAKDVAQNVFTDLARKVGALARRESLTGWLYTSAHFAAAKIVRGENRRREREEKFMRENISETAPELDWEKLRPVLDAAMHELKDTDREAILLRYFENQQFAEVGVKLGLNENAARMRVERAVEKLRAILAQRGLTAGATLASVISANAVQLAPASLAATLTTTAILSAGTGTITLLKIMTLTKLKLTISALVVAGTATAFVLQHQAQEKLRTDNAALSQQLAQLKTENESFSNRLAAVSDSPKFSDAQYNELMKLRGEVGVLHRQVAADKKSEQARAQTERVAKQQMASLKSEVEFARAKAQFKMDEIKSVNTLKQVLLACRLFAGDHNETYPTNFEQITFELGSLPTNSLSVFEFVSAGAVNHVVSPRAVAFRERQPRQKLDENKWNRVYGLADGSVHVATSDDGNFDAWEKQNTEPPPANQ